MTTIRATSPAFAPFTTIGTPELLSLSLSLGRSSRMKKILVGVLLNFYNGVRVVSTTTG